MNSAINLREWNTRAKIDFITITLPPGLNEPKDAFGLFDSGKGRIEVPKKWGKWSGHNDAWISIHDPDRTALQSLVRNFPDTEILGLEITVDFFHPDEPLESHRLKAPHDTLRMSLFPQKHRQMRRVSSRKIFDRKAEIIKKDEGQAATSIGTVYWQNTSGFEKVRCYIKTKDNGKPLPVHSVRIETTLNRGGCQEAGISHLRSLPEFATRLRIYMSPFFFIAAGLQPIIKRVRSKDAIRNELVRAKATDEQIKASRKWTRYGALAAIRYEYRAIPDRAANRVIGSALNELRRDLMKIELP